jgi:hypothetical protein
MFGTGYKPPAAHRHCGLRLTGRATFGGRVEPKRKAAIDISADRG